MKKRELLNLGIVDKDAQRLAKDLWSEALTAGRSKTELRERLRQIAEDPEAHKDDPRFGRLARQLRPTPTRHEEYQLQSDLTYEYWGEDLDEQAHQQMRNACELPVSVAGALMADAHVGYGLPIGGVLATENAVIPYAVGVDIACRVKMTVFDIEPKWLIGESGKYRNILQRETMFGVGKGWREPPDHPVMDEDWSVSPVTRENKNLAWKQIGTSGSGNHFVEFGIVEFGPNSVGVAPGSYVAVVSHSGSRGGRGRRRAATTADSRAICTPICPSTCAI